MTSDDYSKAFEKHVRERWVGMTCPVFYGKLEDVPARYRHYPFIVATITVEGLEEIIRDTETKKTAVLETPSS